MYAAIRLRSGIKAQKDVVETLNALGLTRKNTLVIVPDTKAALGMLRKADNFIAWGTASEELKKLVGDKALRLKAPKGGLKSVKLRHPKGNLGYVGAEINKLAKRMM